MELFAEGECSRIHHPEWQACQVLRLIKSYREFEDTNEQLHCQTRNDKRTIYVLVYVDLETRAVEVDCDAVNSSELQGLWDLYFELEVTEIVY